MQKHCTSERRANTCASHDFSGDYSPTSVLEGTLIAENSLEQGKIAVVYNRGDTPPEITITKGTDQIQTVHANGVAVAIVAQADGQGISRNDVLLVERFVSTTPQTHR